MQTEIEPHQNETLPVKTFDVFPPYALEPVSDSSLGAQQSRNTQQPTRRNEMDPEQPGVVENQEQPATGGTDVGKSKSLLVPLELLGSLKTGRLLKRLDGMNLIDVVMCRNAIEKALESYDTETAILALTLIVISKAPAIANRLKSLK